MATITGSNFIAGQESHEGAYTFLGFDPRTGEPTGQAFHDATPGEVDRAARAAADAFRQTRLFPAAKLADFLEVVAGEIEALGDVLLETADAETALGLPRLTGERSRTTGQLRAFAGLLRDGFYVEAIVDTARPDRQPAPRPDIRRMLIPIGPVAVFGASNFPFAFGAAGGDTASAFAAGCPVIVKAHPGHPATSERFAQAINRAVQACGFPPGFFSLLHGQQVEASRALVQHPAVAAVGFTGSQRAGRALFDLAAARPTPIPVYAEMGSLNPLIVLPGAAGERGPQVAEQLAGSVLLGCGQFCTKPGLIFTLDSPETRAVLDAVAWLMSERAPGVLLNANVARGLAQAVAQTAGRPGVELLAGGAEIARESFAYANTALQTTGAAFAADPALQQELFGPAALFVRCASEAELLDALGALHGSLTASLYAGEADLPLAARLSDLLREKAGRLIWNGVPTGVEVVYAMQHGGPYPATTAPATTSVGLTAIKRFLRPVAYQNVPDALLPDALKNANPLNIWRIVDHALTRARIE